MSDESPSKPMQEKQASEEDVNSSKSRPVVGSAMGFYQEEQERNSWFYLWFRRGVFWAIAPSIFLGKHFELFIFVEQLLVALMLIFGLVNKLINREVKKDQLQQNHAMENGIAKKKPLMENMIVFIAGFGIGIGICMLIIQIVVHSLNL